MLAAVHTVNCKGYRRNPSWPNLRYHSDVCRKSTKKLRVLNVQAGNGT